MPHVRSSQGFPEFTRMILSTMFHHLAHEWSVLSRAERASDLGIALPGQKSSLLLGDSVNLTSYFTCKLVRNL